jgi:hypothetical protein
VSRRALRGALLVGVLVGGCGGDDDARVCASEAGSTACLVDGSGATVRLEAEGFQPGSEVAVAGLNPGAEGQIGKVGTIGGNGKLQDRIVHEGSGQIPEMVVTVQGTSRSGAPVLLTVRRPAG